MNVFTEDFHGEASFCCFNTIMLADHGGFGMTLWRGELRR